jgi:succinoglycan biosynthesis transport protein ExoP
MPMALPPTRDDFGGPDLAPETTTQEAVGPYLRAVRRHWRFVVLVTLLTVAAATFTVERSKHSYQASASVLVSPLASGDPAWIGIGVMIQSGDPARDLQTALGLIDSVQAASGTAAAIGPPWTTQSVQSAVAVTPLGQSDVVSITATASTPQEAARLANTYARVTVADRGAIVQSNIASELAVLQARSQALKAAGASSATEVANISTQIDELEAAQATHGDPTISVAQAAQPPTSPSGTSHALILLLSLVGGLALASVAALGLEFFSRPVRDEEEVTKLFPAPILASIPRIRRTGTGPVLPWLLPPAAFEQVRMLRVQLELAERAPVIMITSAGAGDGKTTLVTALAAAFSESGQDVILMDLDLRKPSLAMVLEIDMTQNAWGNKDDSEQPLDALAPVPRLPNVKLLPLPVASPLSIDEVMLRVPLLLAQAQRVAGCVIIDTAPVGEVSESLRIAPMCDTVVFVARPRHTDRRQLARARELLSRTGARIAGLVLIGQTLGRMYGDPSGYGQSGSNGLVPNSAPWAISKAPAATGQREPHIR